MQKNKLIIFIGTLQSGGAERVVSEISAMYADHFKEIVLLTYYDSPIFYRIDSRIRLECIEARTKTRNRVKNAFWMRKFVQHEKPDVFLSFMISLNLFSIWSLAFVKKHLVVCERNDPSKIGSRLMRKFRNFSYHFCDRIEVQTLNGKKYFSKSIQEKITIIANPNHITLEQRNEVLRTPKENRIANVGRLIQQKNYPLLINSFADVLKYYPEYKLDLYGDGEDRNELQNLVNSLGIDKSVVFHGVIPNAYMKLGSAKVYVLPSYIEGMPNALMEAMAVGMPCVATDVSGVRDIITDGENGFIVTVNDKESMVDRIKKLIESDILRNKFSHNTISVFEKFEKERIFKQWLELVSF